MLLTLQLLILVLLLALSAFFSSGETAMFLLNPLQLRKLAQTRGARGAAVQKLLAAPTRLLSAILVGNIFVNVFASAVGYAIAERWWPTRGAAVAIPSMTLLLLFVGEVGPKRIGFAHAETLALAYARPMTLVVRLTAPLRKLLEIITDRLKNTFALRGRSLNNEEFETVLDIGEEEGLLSREEWAMVKAVVHLEDLRASDVMTPRVDLVGLDLEKPPPDVLAWVRSVPFKRLLLYRGQLDRMEGFLDVRRLLLDPEHNLARATQPPVFVPEMARLQTVLLELQSRGSHLAVVVDEYGGTAGLIARGDILEEITGEVYSDLGGARSILQAYGPNRWLVDPNLALDELNRKLGLTLVSENGNRLSGWLAEQLQRVPAPEDTVEAQGVRVTVLETKRLRTTLARLEKLGTLQQGGDPS